MNILGKLAGVAGIVILTAALAGCATFGDSPSGSHAGFTKSAASTRALVSQTSAVVDIHGPYDAALACMARIPDLHGIKVGVGNVADLTGKVDMNSTDGTGSFIGNGASAMFSSSLAQVGVQLIEFSPEFRGDVDWLISKGNKGIAATPNFVVMGGVTGLDFQPGISGGFQIAGIGPQSRAYTASGSMDTRLVTLPFGNVAAGLVIATSKAAKQFAAVENKFGFGSFIGAGPGVTYASFDISSGQREPMQLTLRFLIDYETVDLLGNYLDQMSAAKNLTADRRPAVAACRQLLEIPASAGMPALRIASAK